MTRSALAVLAVVGAALLTAAPAPAQAPEPLTLTNVSPANRAVVPPTPTGGIPWQVAGAPTGASVLVTVTSSPATGPDGVTLLDQNRVDFFFLSENDAAPGAYAGRSDPGPNAWSADAATYYWQARATWTDAAGVFHTAASGIVRLVIGTPPPAGQTPAPGGTPSRTRTTLAMSRLDAPYYVRRTIRQRTRRTPVRLRYGCVRRTSRSFRCRPTWRDSRNVYAATVTFTHARRGSRIVATGTFTGTRATRTCTRRRTVKACGQRFRWKVLLAARPLGTARRSL